MATMGMEPIEVVPGVPGGEVGPLVEKLPDGIEDDAEGSLGGRMLDLGERLLGEILYETERTEARLDHFAVVGEVEDTSFV
jgi:hypothetical protein